MARQYILQHDGYGNYSYLYYKDLQKIINQFNSNPTVQANGLSVSLTGEGESYAYQAVLSYRNLNTEFLIYQDLRWGLGRTILASTESEYAYFTAWNLWVEFTGFKRQ